MNTTTNNGLRDAPRHSALAHNLSRKLGWFSIALGTFELLRPRQVAQGAGVPGPEPLVRGYGAREVAAGIGLLSNSRNEPWMWARVAGDALDIATVANGMLRRRANGQRAAGSLLMLLGVTAIDLYCASALTRERTSLKKRPAFAYDDRSGFPNGPQQARGIAAPSNIHKLNGGTPHATPPARESFEVQGS